MSSIFSRKVGETPFEPNVARVEVYFEPTASGKTLPPLVIEGNPVVLGVLRTSGDLAIFMPNGQEDSEVCELMSALTECHEELHHPTPQVAEGGPWPGAVDA